MGYRNEAENVIRPGHLKRRLIGFGIGAVCIVVAELLILWGNRAYCAARGLEPSLATLLMSFSTLFSWGTLSFSLLDPGNLAQILSDWLALWPVNLVILLFMLLSIRSLSKYRGMEHGSARWADRAELAKLSNPNGTIPIAEGIYVDPKNNDLKNLHELGIGDTGSGKSFRLLTPELLQMTGSYVVVDVKGSLYRQTAKIMREAGYRIKVLNLKELASSNTFNPLSYLNGNEDILKLVDAFTYNSRKEGANAGDQFWEDTMQMLMTSIITYLHTTPEEQKTFSRVVDLITSLEVAQGKILPISEYERLMKEREIKNPYDTAVMLYKQFKQAAGETLQSVLISCTSRLRIWNDEAVRILTNSDEMELETLADERTVLYVILPAGNKTYRVISSMFFSTLFTTLMTVAERRGGGKLPMLLSVVMDEFANLGKIPDFETYITLMRSYGVRLVPVIQGTQQLKQHYEKAEDTIISNCAIYNYLGTQDKTTKEEVVKRLGKTTILEENSSRQVGGRQGGGNVSDRGMGRELLTFDELSVIGGDRSIVFIDGYRPIFAEKFKTENHPLFDKLGIDDPGHPHYKNNSDVVQNFAALAAKHQREYEQQMAASRSRSNLPIQPQTESKAGDEEEGGRKDSMMRELSAEEFERSIGLDDLAQEKPGGEAEIKGEMEKELEADTSLLAALKNRNRRNQEVS